MASQIPAIGLFVQQFIQTKKASKLHIIGLCRCEGNNPPATSGFLSQRAPNTESALCHNVFMY